MLGSTMTSSRQQGKRLGIARDGRFGEMEIQSGNPTLIGTRANFALLALSKLAESRAIRCQRNAP
jgi:hypothetical protein